MRAKDCAIGSILFSFSFVFLQAQTLQAFTTNSTSGKEVVFLY